MKKSKKYLMSHLSKSIEKFLEFKYPKSKELKRYEEISPGLADKIIKIHSDQISLKRLVVILFIIVLIYLIFHQIF